MAVKVDLEKPYSSSIGFYRIFLSEVLLILIV